MITISKITKFTGLILGNIRYSGPKDSNQVAITFDDGPSIYTENILEILSKKGVKGTFFIEGKKALSCPEIVKGAYCAGHDIGIHMWNHVRVRDLDKQQRQQEVLQTDNLLKELGIENVRFIRPPWGEYDWTYLLSSLKLKKKGVLWSVDCGDWKQPESRLIVNRIAKNVNKGAIILLHDGGGDRSNTVKALPIIIDNLIDKGFNPVSLSTLFRYGKNE